MNRLSDELNLKYTTQFNIRKGFAIIVGASALILGLSFLNRPDSPYRIIGIAAIILFVRIVLGSPFESVLTDESLERFKTSIKSATKKNDLDMEKME